MKNNLFPYFELINILNSCGMDSKQHLQFPLSQRRKRRVLFTQAQVRVLYYLRWLESFTKFIE